VFFILFFLTLTFTGFGHTSVLIYSIANEQQYSYNREQLETTTLYRCLCREGYALVCLARIQKYARRQLLSLFVHRHIQAEEAPAPIQPNPQIKMLRETRRILLVGIMILLVFLLVFEIWMAYQNSLYPQIPPDLAILVFPLILGIPFLLFMSIGLLSIIKQERHWQRIEALRFTALVEDQQLLASEQPLPDAEAMALPATICTRGTVKSALANALVFFIVIMGSYLFYALVLLHQTWLSSLPYLFFSSLFILVLPLASLRTRSTILVSAEGMRVPVAGGHAWVAWHEMRLFACYRAQESVKNGAALTYELSTASTIIRWTWLQRRTFWSTEVPILPLAEHTAQMKALVRLVVAKTGLSLYDLNKGQVGEHAPAERAPAISVNPQLWPTQTGAPATMICSNPLLGHLKMMRFLYLGIAAFLVVMMLFLNITSYLSGLTGRAGLAGFFTDLWFSSSTPSLLVLLWLAMALLFSFIERAWKRIERLRFSAASGNERLQALNQPRPDAEVLRLPMTITLRMARQFGLLMALAFLIGMILFLLVMDLINPLGGTLFLSWPGNIIMLIVLAALALGIYLLFTQRRTHIEVSANGIRVYQSKHMDARVSWQEAHLFACYFAPAVSRTDAELTYELASGSNVVRWSCAQHAGSPWQMWTATVPFEEHRTQMRALAKLVTARTGLTLYDLRREP
jgi:hypothetical protein